MAGDVKNKMQKLSLKLKQSDWDKKEKEFLRGFINYFNEISDSVNLLRKNKGNPLVRSQLCLAFICIDSYSRFHRIFLGERNIKSLDKDNKNRFKDWLNMFVFTSKNKIYSKHKKKIKCDASVIWRIRNAFLHFYSFPKPKKGESRIFFFFNVPDKQHEDIEIKFKARGHKVVFIDAYFLINAIFEGVLLQCEYLKKMLKKRPGDYVNAVLFAHNIVMQESASTIRI